LIWVGRETVNSCRPSLRVVSIMEIFCGKHDVDI
jgi:hypothetical protein